MKITGIAFSMTVVGALALLAGCSTSGVHPATVGATATIEDTGQDSNGAGAFDAYLVYGTESLRRKVVISNMLARKSEDKTGGLTQTSVTLTNTTKKPLNIAYKFMWFDSDGFEIMPDSFAWTPIVVQGLEGRTVQSVSPRTSAVTFKVKVALQ